MRRIGFLATDAVIDADVPDQFDAWPHLRTAFGVNGGFRQLSFFPSPRFEHPRSLDYLREVGSAPARAGNTVSVYEQLQPPPVRIAVWDVPNGFVTTAFNPEDWGELDVVLANVAISGTETDYPRASFYPPLRPEDRRYPNRRDIAMFVGDSGEALEHNLIFTHLPSASQDADTGSHDQLTWYVHYRGNIKVSWSGPKSQDADIRSRFQKVVDSLEVIQV
jgi:hypothetical protein